MVIKRKQTGWLLCAGIAAAVCGCGGSDFRNPSRGETLIMATNAYDEPYVYYEGEEIVGIDVEIARAIADKLGMELQIENMDFDSILEAVNDGDAHMGMAGMAVTQERQKYADFSDPYMRFNRVVAVHADSEIEGSDDFKDRIVGVPDSIASEIIIDSLEDSLIRQYDQEEEALQALSDGIVDAVILERESAEEQVAGLQGLEILDEKFVARGYGIAVAKGNVELLDDIDKALDAVIADGTVYQIVNKYLTKQ